MRTILLGQPISADEAETWGLVAEPAEDSMTLKRAIAVATGLARHGPDAVRLAKKAISRGEQVGQHQKASVCLPVSWRNFLGCSRQPMSRRDVRAKSLLQHLRQPGKAEGC